VINAPGEVCENWADELGGWFVELDVMATRIDVAMDVDPPELARKRLVQMYRAFKLGRVETRMRRKSCKLIRSDGGDDGMFSQIIQSDGDADGWTLYLGRPQSELMMRAYDRRGPLRIEMQWRPQGEAREIVPELLVRKGACHMWRRCASRVRLKLPWYEELLVGDIEDVPRDPRSTSALDEAMFQLNRQFGPTFFMLGQMGFTLDDLRSTPGQFSGVQSRKFASWLDAHERAGNDVSDARRELEKRCPK
jgi:hypothetical protein